jgi:hypothetical protein
VLGAGCGFCVNKDEREEARGELRWRSLQIRMQRRGHPRVGGAAGGTGRGARVAG